MLSPGKALKIIVERLKNKNVGEIESQEYAHICLNCKYRHMVEGCDPQDGILRIIRNWCDKDRSLMSTLYDTGNFTHFTKDCKSFEYGNGQCDRYGMSRKENYTYNENE